MNIEHQQDGNNVYSQGATMTPGMTDMQRAIVADHLAELARDGAALRAERERDHLRDRASIETDLFDHRPEIESRRVRLGRWFVAFGERLAGPGRRGVGEPAPAMAVASASPKAPDGPCDDQHD